jgi:DNA processing protein
LEESELIYQIAITKVDGVGPNLAKSLIAYCGSASAVFKQKKTELKKIPGIGAVTAANISKFQNFKTIEHEIELLNKHQIKTYFYLDKDYPQRLKHCEDCPLVLFYKGNADLNAKNIISVVGTRKSTYYGKQFTEELIQTLKDYDVLVVSGLASGTDTNAHKSCVKFQIPTVGVLGHGLATIYPSSNYKLSEEMLENGGILTEYCYNTPGARENFPKRNRIVAGMCDALIVVESGMKGGSLITADLANQYNRDVFALPGKINDAWSQGCNRLVSKNQAAIISDIDGLIAELNLKSTHNIKSPFKLDLFNALTEKELDVVEILKTDKLTIDQIYYHTNIEIGQLSLLLLNLELKNIVSVLPGKIYTLYQSM